MSVSAGTAASAPPKPLDALFTPRSIAIAGAGAQPESMGSRYLQMLEAYGYAGNLYAVNRAGAACGSARGYRRVSEIPGFVDLCLVAVPAEGVGAILADCAERGVRIAQVFSSGFDDHGGVSPRSLLEAARGITRIVGPNCLGTHCPRGRITFVRDADPLAGSVALISQSGGLSADILHQADVLQLRLSKLVSIGDSIDLGAAEILAYLGDDPDVAAIGLYVEGAGSPHFFSVLAEVAQRKAVVILKGGRTAAGARSAASHTGMLAGDHAIWRAAMAQFGVIEALDVDDLLGALTALQRGVPLPRGPRTALIGNGGGMTVLATDTLSEEGLTTASLSAATLERIAALELPAGSSIGSALDFPAGALNKIEPSVLRDVFSAIVADRGVDAVVAHFNLIPFLNYASADALADALGTVLSTVERNGKPLYAALRSSPHPGVERLRAHIGALCATAGVPVFRDATVAARAAANAWRRSRFLADEEQRRPDAANAPLADETVRRCRALFRRVRADARTMLTQPEAFEVLAALGIPHSPVALAHTADEAAELADACGWPVALKIESADVVHKSDRGGVRLGVASRDEARRAFTAIVQAARANDPDARVDGAIVQRMAPPATLEAIVGITRDPLLGPVVLVGTGGVLVELFEDVALRIAPLTAHDARCMWQGLRSRPLFEGYRGGGAVDTAAFEALIVKVALAAAAFGEIAELDLNPILLSPSGAIAVDCRIRLEPGDPRVRIA